MRLVRRLTGFPGDEASSIDAFWERFFALLRR
jgi:hypothetical protein